MFNNVLLIGRTTEKPTIKQLESGQVVGNLSIAVNRPFKNSDGEYDTYFIHCTLWNAIAQNAAEFCNKGSVIAIRGHLITKEEVIYNERGEKKTIKVPDVYVERLHFIKL